MRYVLVDVESDGPIPGDYSMISIGSVMVDEKLDKTFYGKLRPISHGYKQKRLDLLGVTRKETLTYDDPKDVMGRFADWVQEISDGEKVVFLSDNNGYDFGFVNWYFHHFLGSNPFGHSSHNLVDLFKGLKRAWNTPFKALREKVSTVPHDHNPVNDAKGNAQLLLHMRGQLGFKINL